MTKTLLALSAHVFVPAVTVQLGRVPVHTGTPVEAVQTVRANKQAYAEAESRAQSRVTPAAAFASLLQG